MSAAERVRRAAATVLAAWERGVQVDPQSDAAQALDDAGMLLDPDVADELAAYRALELGAPDSRVSAACPKGEHPTWLRELEDTRGCPWCRVAELESGIEWRDAERDRWADVHAIVERAIDKGWTSIDTLDLEVELGLEPTAPSPEESVARLRSVLAPSEPVERVEAEALDKMRAALPLGDADFFRVGRTYTDGTGYSAPEITTYFRVEHVTRHPDRGHRRAIGWMRTGEPDAGWHGDFRDEGEFDGWTDTTGPGDAS